jgi:hypothetical protein
MPAAEAATSQHKAARMLAEIRIPAGSRAVRSLPGRQFAKPSQTPACNPLETATATWIVPMTPTRLTRFLTSHVPPSLFASIRGAATNGEPPVFSFTDTPRHRSQNAVEFTYSHAGDSTGLRIDAIVVPHDSACLSSGGGASASG